MAANDVPFNVAGERDGVMDKQRDIWQSTEDHDSFTGEY